MSNWKMRNIEEKYSSLLPTEYIKGWEVDQVILTTFSLHENPLMELLYDLGAMSLIAKNRIHIFLDNGNRCGKTTNTSIISEKYIHGIRIFDGKQLFAFHPKIILLRYVMAGKIRYVLYVLSKNISESTLLDVYGVAYGEVNVEENMVEKNGKSLADYMSQVFSSAQKQIQDDEKNTLERTISELEKVSFQMNGGEEDIEFYEASQVWEKIRDKKDLIIVSPFLSEGFVKNVMKNVKIIISSEQGFGMLKEETINFLIDNNKCRCWSWDKQPLHAKIYCWKENGKAHYLIGSSNATNNGCNISGVNPSNMEFNVGFSRDEAEYESFLDTICSVSEAFIILDYKTWKTDEQNTFSPRNAFDWFCRFITVTCKVENGNYKLQIEKDKSECDYKSEFAVKGPHEIEFHKIDFSQNGIECIDFNTPISRLIVKITNTRADEEDEKDFFFSYSLYNKWDQETQKKLDESCLEAYIRLQEQLQKQLIRGASRRSFAINNRVEEKKNIGREQKSQDKIYAYEELLTLAQKFGGREFYEKLNELEQLADNILVVRQDEKQKALKDLIDKIRVV